SYCGKGRANLPFCRSNHFNNQEFLAEHLVLKGGTAINTVIFNLPRLSVDIDMDYVPNGTRDEMESSRNKISAIIKDYMESEGYSLSPASRFSFSLDAFLYQYRNSSGNRDNIKIELNYSLRSHLFEPVYLPMLTEVFDDNFLIHTVAPMEIFSAKANALLSRAAARDLYDFDNMINYALFDESENDTFRKSIIFYNTISQETVNFSFDTSAIDSLNFAKIKRDLFPVLRSREFFDLEGKKTKIKKYFAELMNLSQKEKQYMEAFAAKQYMPELLFDDEDVIERVRKHPMALWKCRV
ncbi:MAG: nucleotidyl transferase AbiEii/AbiGii toxin family protein, partial [Lachnospiraceae bacterium]|nr:nucleotidyl transferase AbiEii/AbiGii toxin family protein [Lachnospiraceae bacterium]